MDWHDFLITADDADEEEEEEEEKDFVDQFSIQ